MKNPLFVLLLSYVWLLVSFTGCVQQPAKSPPAPPDCPPLPTQAMDDLNARNQALEEELAGSNTENVVLTKRISDLEIALLQKTAQTNELERRVSAQQKRLDDAITEVVRTKSKLRSIESKAEAASTIAEAEIAVKTMQSRIETEDREAMAALEKAQRLLAQSAVEFKARNYGGALYLAVQSKAQVNAGDRVLQSGGAIALEAGETGFDQALPLTLTKNTNLRAGPDLDQTILATLKQGTEVVGYGYKENWIRVSTEAGLTGWVYQSLVMAR